MYKIGKPSYEAITVNYSSLYQHCYCCRKKNTGLFSSFIFCSDMHGGLLVPPCFNLRYALVTHLTSSPVVGRQLMFVGLSLQGEREEIVVQRECRVHVASIIPNNTVNSWGFWPDSTSIVSIIKLHYEKLARVRPLFKLIQRNCLAYL